MKTSHLMELPPSSLLSGSSEIRTLEIHYPMPLLELSMRCTKNQPPQSSPSTRSFTAGRRIPPPTSSSSPFAPIEDFYGRPVSNPETKKQISTSQSQFEPKQVLIEKEAAATSMEKLATQLL